VIDCPSLEKLNVIGIYFSADYAANFDLQIINCAELRKLYFKDVGDIICEIDD
jgi:hypothetical protein